MVYLQAMPKKKDKPTRGYKQIKQERPYDFQDRLKHIVRKGKSYRSFFDFYHFCLQVNWVVLVFGIIGFYFLMGFVFAGYYYILKTSFDTTVKSYQDSLFIAMCIFTSQGTGGYDPVGMEVKFATIVQGLISIIVGASVTGLIFARFSKPEARIKFADSLLKTTFNNQQVLQFRVANERDNFCYDVCLKFSVFFAETSAEGMRMRRIYDLELEQQDVVAFGLSLIGYHIINEHSPLYGLSIEDLMDKEAQFIIFFLGTDAVFGEAVQANRVFSPADIVEENGHFVDMIFDYEDSDQQCLDLTKLNKVIKYSDDNKVN